MPCASRSRLIRLTIWWQDGPERGNQYDAALAEQFAGRGQGHLGVVGIDIIGRVVAPMFLQAWSLR